MSIVEDLERQLRTMPDVLLAVLYGSMARGEEGAGSDADVGLLLRDQDLAARYAAEASLGRAARTQLDVVYLDEAPPLLRFEIARDGVLLLERSPHLWQDFKARAMLDWWDWAPTARRIYAAACQRLRERACGQA
jgi:predicted nucleotidyltransferase